MTHGYPERVWCVDHDGRPQTPAPLTPHTPHLAPFRVSCHPDTGRLVIACRDRQDETRVVLSVYGAAGGVWAAPSTHTLQGEWISHIPRGVVWVSATDVVMGLEDKDRVWWFVRHHTATHREVARSKAWCDIQDMSVSPEGDTLWVCDNNKHIHVYSSSSLERTLTFSPSHPVREVLKLYALCGVSGRRVAVCHWDTHDWEDTVSVSLYDRKGGYVRDLITDLPTTDYIHNNNFYIVRVSEPQSELFVFDSDNYTLKKYSLFRRLEDA